MPTATAVQSPVSSPSKINEGWFLSVARAYNAQRKLIDALSAADNPDNAFAEAMIVRKNLAHMVSEGSDYTPSLALGFTSANSATIAAGILGEGLTGSQLRKRFSDIGKPKK